MQSEEAIERRQFAIGLIFVLIAAVAFSAKSIWIKLLYLEGLSGIDQLQWRMILSVPVYLAWLAFHYSQWRVLKRNDWLLVFFCGFIGYYLASYLDVAGLEYITASLERLVLFTYPAFVLVLAAIFFRRKILPRQLMALAIAYTGLMIVLWGQRDASKDVVTGTMLILGSSLSYALYLIGMESLLRRHPAVMIASLAMVISTAATLLHSWIAHGGGIPLNAGYSTKVWGLLSVLAIVSTVLPKFFLAVGISRVGAGNAAIAGTLGPVATLSLAWLILDEPLGLQEIVGTIGVIYGISRLRDYRK